MKKITLILLCLLITGCSVVEIDTNNVDNILDVVLSQDNNLYNRIGKGYKYYIPRGVSYMDTDELNDKLYSNGIYYYLYIDTVSYFYKIDINYEENSSLYFSKKIEGDKKGYLEIKENNNKYYITFVYNYAKIEAITEKEDIAEVILNSSYILSTVKFNDNIVELSLNEEYLTNKEEQYTKFKSEEKEEYFLEFVDETENN
ncbi:MAG: hypothetical protein PHN42_04870 [Bacilli bacterium]|nr:hypothetical protein [Bacilli bacterium]